VQAEKNLQHVLRLILIAFFLTALSLVFWSILRADDILTRADNPRQVEAILAIQRGQILDRMGVVLAQTGSPEDTQRRHYPYPTVGPAVGYYSFRYGADGVEDSYESTLAGDVGDFWQEWWRNSLHENKVGRNIQLTLDIDRQTQADALMQDHQGALILIKPNDDQKDGANFADILALVSHPGYDPNQLRERFPELVAAEKAPLLNRVTKGQYQPGLVLQPFILAYALSQELLDLADVTAHPNRPVLIHDTATYCASVAPEPSLWQDSLSHRCPGPMLDLGETLTLADLNEAFNRFKLTEQPALPLDSVAADYPPLTSAAQAAIGQDNLIVTPLQVAYAWLALNQNGRFPTLRLVSHTQTETGEWQPVEVEMNELETAVSPTVAAKILAALPQKEGIVEYSTLVLSGPDGTTNTWYLGAAASGEVVVIVLEDTADLAAVEKIGRALLRQ